MPSSAAQIAAKERELGRTLSPAEKLALKKTNPSVAIREETHALTRTYKGNNTAEKIAADSADLGKAAKTDAANLIEAGKKTGVDLTKAAKKVEEMTTSQQAISLLGNVFDPQLFGSLQLEHLDEEAFILDYQSGVAFTYDRNMRLMSVHIYGAETDGFKVHQEPLPFGLKFGMSFAESNRLLPYPKKQGGGGTSNVDGKPIPIWLRHDTDNFSLHLQFGDALNMITLMHPSVVPTERAN